MRNQHAGLPFTDSDEAIRAALEDVSIPTLLVASALVKQMMDFLVGTHVADEYVPMMLEELGLDGLDLRQDPEPREVPDWGPQQTSVSEINDFARMMFSEWIESQVPDDPELLAKVMPGYPATGKRTLQDNGSWLATLRRDNVELVRAGIDHLESDGIVDSAGVKHRADVLIWSTGFAYHEPLMPMRITGRDGVDLREHWGDRPRAHLGITVPGFPNFFCLYGPGTNLASGGSIIFASECEVRTMVWASPHIDHNYYANDAGEVHGLNPWRVVDWWAWTRQVDADDHVFT